MPNIILNYYNGSSFIELYPKINLNNNDNTLLSSSFISNLSASKITSGVFNIARIPNLTFDKISGGTDFQYGSVGGTSGSHFNITLKNNFIANSGVFISKNLSGASNFDYFIGVHTSGIKFDVGNRQYSEITAYKISISYNNSNVGFSLNVGRPNIGFVDFLLIGTNK